MMIQFNCTLYFAKLFHYVPLVNYKTLRLKQLGLFYIWVQKWQGSKHASGMTYYYVKQERGEREREQMSRVYVPLGCRQTSRVITMASAGGLGSWAANCLSVQRWFLEARLHVWLGVVFLAERMWKGWLWPHLACAILIHMHSHKITVCWSKKKKKASFNPINWHTCNTVPGTTTESTLITLPWMACAFFSVVPVLKGKLFRLSPFFISRKAALLPTAPSFFSLAPTMTSVLLPVVPLGATHHLMEMPLRSLLPEWRLDEAVRFGVTFPSVAPDATRLRLCSRRRQSPQQQDEIKIFLTLSPFHPSFPRFFLPHQLY